MFSIPSYAREKAIAYLLSRQGKDGGYLFYQYENVFESAIDDTYYALATLRSLGVDAPNKDLTLRFLYSKIRREDLYIAYYCTNALCVLQGGLGDLSRSTYYASIRVKMLNWLERLIKPVQDNCVNGLSWTLISPSNSLSDEIYAIELPSKLELIFMVLDLSRKLNLGLHKQNIGDELAKDILEYLKLRNSFGIGVPNTSLIFYSLGILKLLDYPLKGLEDIKQSIMKCEDKSGGFNITPYSRFRTLEYTYKATEALRLLEVQPRFLELHKRFILGCQNGNGGFRRSIFVGISTLKDTFYATSALINLTDQT